MNLSQKCPLLLSRPKKHFKLVQLLSLNLFVLFLCFQWDLVCGDAYKTSLATTIYFVGVMLGGLVFGTLSDKFGRRPILLFTMFTPSLIGIMVFFIKNYIAFIILRFVLGFLLQVSIQTQRSWNINLHLKILKMQINKRIKAIFLTLERL